MATQSLAQSKIKIRWNINSKLYHRLSIKLWINMKPLKTTQWLLTWQSFSPPNQSASVKKRMAYFGATSAIFVSVFYYMTSCFIVLMKFSTTDMKVTVFAFMSFSGSAALIYSMLNAFQARCKINKIFEKLSVIYTESKIDLLVKLKVAFESWNSLITNLLLSI